MMFDGAAPATTVAAVTATEAPHADAGAQGATADKTTASSSTSSTGAATGLIREVQGAHQVVFIDGSVDKATQLAQAAPADADVVLLDPSRDGIQQISEFLQSHEGMDAIHIVSHGDAGEITLGNTTLSEGNLADHAAELRDWGSHLAKGADVLIYGCDVARGDVGQHFVSDVASLTGADVAASTDLTGTADHGGNWTLEAKAGDIQTKSIDFGTAGWDGDLTSATGAVYFLDGYQMLRNNGTNNNPDWVYTGCSASVSSGKFDTAEFNISSISFTPSAGCYTGGTFQGNDVTGTLTFKGTYHNADGTATSAVYSLAGAISRVDQPGGKVASLYFWTENYTGRTVTNTASDEGLAFVLLLPNRTTGSYSASAAYSTSANQGAVAGALTALLATQTGYSDKITAQADTASLYAGGSATGTAGTGGTGVLHNDTDADAGHSLTVYNIGAGTGAPTLQAGSTVTGTYGDLTLNSNGSYSYSANHASGVATGQQVTDTFTYQVGDGLGGFATATLTFTVSGPGPQAVADTGSVVQGHTVSGTGTGVLANDSDTTGAAIHVSGVTTGTANSAPTSNVGSVVHGTYGDLTLNSDGSYSYTADNASEVGVGASVTDTFTYAVTDAQSRTSYSTLTITVHGTGPQAAADIGSVTQGNTLTVDATHNATSNVLHNDTDSDSEATLTVAGVTAGTSSSAQSTGVGGSGIDGTYGHLTLNADGTYTYDTNGVFPSGVSTSTALNDVFTYTVSDGTHTTNATLTIHVTPLLPSAPTVAGQTTTDTTPTIQGTWDNAEGNTLEVTVNGHTYSGDDLTIDGTHWSLQIPDGSELTAGQTYDVTAKVKNTYDNTTVDSTSGEVVVTSASLGTPTVASQITAQTTPTITGTWDNSAGDTLTVSINDHTYSTGDGSPLTTNGGSWSLAIPEADALSPGTIYNVVATVTDSATHTVTDATSNEVTVISVPTVVSQTTAQTTPTITGTWDNSAGDTLAVTINGHTYAPGAGSPLTTNGGNWSLAIPAGDALSYGTTYSVVATVTDSATHTVADATSSEVTVINRPTVAGQTTDSTTPTISGTWDNSTGDTLTVTINGHTYTQGDGVLVTNGGSWSLTVSPNYALSRGTSYEVVATTTDAGGHTVSDVSTNEVTLTKPADLSSRLPDVKPPTDVRIPDLPPPPPPPPPVQQQPTDPIVRPFEPVTFTFGDARNANMTFTADGPSTITDGNLQVQVASQSTSSTSTAQNQAIERQTFVINAKEMGAGANPLVRVEAGLPQWMKVETQESGALKVVGDRPLGDSQTYRVVVKVKRASGEEANVVVEVAPTKADTSGGQAQTKQAPANRTGEQVPPAADRRASAESWLDQLLAAFDQNPAEDHTIADAAPSGFLGQVAADANATSTKAAELAA